MSQIKPWETLGYRDWQQVLDELQAANALAKAVKSRKFRPWGCAFCDSGVLRQSAVSKGHQHHCAYGAMDDALTVFEKARGLK